MYFLVVNVGSSSIKFSLYDAETLHEEHAGAIAGIGLATVSCTIDGEPQTIQAAELADHTAALRLMMDWLKQTTSLDAIAAVGHRIVHGGPIFSAPQQLSRDDLQELRKLVPLDPEHLPAQTSVIEQLLGDLPDIPQIACFDTAFFHDLPTRSRVLPIPRKFEAAGVRRYGFHGLSYEYLLAEFERVAGPEAAYGNVIIAHLGNGASLAAFQAGKPIDTSMGFTPAGGVPMSTRSGDLDPAVITYLQTEQHLSSDEVEHLINFESGLAGISSVSGDMKQLLDLEDHNEAAHDAIEIFCYSVRKYIGAYSAALGGLHSLIFSGGIGEVSVPIRARICADLGFLGVELDEARNQANAELISSDGADVGVHVLPTNEALTIARAMRQLLVKPQS